MVLKSTSVLDESFSKWEENRRSRKISRGLFYDSSSEMSAGVSKHLQGCPFCNLPTDLQLSQSLSSTDGHEEEHPPAGGEEGCGGTRGDAGGRGRA